VRLTGRYDLRSGILFGSPCTQAAKVGTVWLGEQSGKLLQHTETVFTRNHTAGKNAAKIYQARMVITA